MTLIDSNIIIYSYLPQYEYLRTMISTDSVFVSEISRVEVLGYHKLTSDEENYFRNIFDLVGIIPPSREIFDKAIEIRRNYKLSLGDSIVGATALVQNLTIYTRNMKDFENI